MIKQSILALALAGIAGPALAQSSDTSTRWSGFYVGASAGISEPRGGDDARILFDTNLDGTFGDTVRTGAGADAFSPGSCGSGTNARTPGAGCIDDKGGSTFGGRLGFDWQFGNLVAGAVAEYTTHDLRDSVTSFTTTPASYTFTRELERMLALRARAGMVFGQESAWLAYATAGAVQADIDNSFTSTNTANAFRVSDGGGRVRGVQAGLGIERKLVGNVSLGLEYLRTRLDDEDTRVRASRGTAPATNPFVLVNASGTDFRRSDDELDLDTVQLVLNYRF